MRQNVIERKQQLYKVDLNRTISTNQNSALNNRLQYEALSNVYCIVCRVFSPEPGTELYCFQQNCNILKLVYWLDMAQPPEHPDCFFFFVFFKKKKKKKNCLPFTQKIRKFRMECKWKDYFCLSERNFSRGNGVAWKVDRNSQTEFPNGKCAFHLLGLLVPDLLAWIVFDPIFREKALKMEWANPRGNFQSGFDQSH